MTDARAGKLTDEQISQLRFKAKAWNRELADVNKVIWEPLDVILEEELKSAYKDKQYEAFAILTTLKYRIQTAHGKRLLAELKVVIGG